MDNVLAGIGHNEELDSLVFPAKKIIIKFEAVQFLIINDPPCGQYSIRKYCRGKFWNPVASF